MYNQNSRNQREERPDGYNRNPRYGRQGRSEGQLNHPSREQSSYRNTAPSNDRRLGYRDGRNYEMRYIPSRPVYARRNDNPGGMPRNERRPKKIIPSAEEMDKILSDYMNLGS